METEDRGWYSVDGKYLCATCLLDRTLQEYVNKNATSGFCTYCGCISGGAPFSLPFNEVMPLIIDGVSCCWSTPIDAGLLYDSREGGWQGPLFESCEILESLQITSRVGLIEDITNSLTNDLWTNARAMR